MLRITAHLGGGVRYQFWRFGRGGGVLGLSFRDLEEVLALSFRDTLYCSLVRSNLEYCSVVWCPFTKRNVNKLEIIQRRATRFILKLNEPYDVGLSKLNLLTLEQRRFVVAVTFLFKALNGHLQSSQVLNIPKSEMLAGDRAKDSGVLCFVYRRC